MITKKADFFYHQLPLSVPPNKRDERIKLPEIKIANSVDVPEGLAGLGERQLFVLIENTRFGTYRRDPTNVEKRSRASERQAHASAPPAGRRGRSPTSTAMEVRAEAGRGRSASPYAGKGRGSSSSRPAHMIQEVRPGILMARPPPPPPVATMRNVTDYISAEEWDGVRSGAYGSTGARERTRSRTRAEAAETAGGIPAPRTLPDAGEYHGPMGNSIRG